MKCKQLALRVLSTAAILSIVTSCAAPAFAGTYNLAYGDISVKAEKDKTTVGYYDKDDDGNVNSKSKEDNDEIKIVSKDDEGNNVSTKNTVEIDVDKNAKTDITFDDVTIETNKDVTSSSTGNGYKDDNGITVKNEGEANITLKDTTVDTRNHPTSSVNSPDGGAGMAVSGKGNTTVELEGENKLSSGDGHAGLQKDSQNKTNEGTLTITNVENKKGELEANGGASSAGIGGGYEKASTSNITIEGNVNITANGSSNSDTSKTGAGIGGGYQGNANNITIKANEKGEAPTVDATGSTGIGGGYGGNDNGGSGTKIKIDGAMVTAKGLWGAGIGGGVSAGNGKSKADVTITNHAKVTATGASTSGGSQGMLSGIGGIGGTSTITIDDSDVTSAGIGTNSNGSEITIKGESTVYDGIEGKNNTSRGIGAATGKSIISILEKAHILMAGFIGNGSDGNTTIRIQDDATIDVVGSAYNRNQYAIGGSGSADITIGGSSVEGRAQDGTVTIKQARAGDTVIGGGTSSNVTIEGNVDMRLKNDNTAGGTTKLWIKDGNQEMDANKLMGTISDSSKIIYQRKEDAVYNAIYQIVHGKEACHWTKDTTASKAPTCTEDGKNVYYCTYENEEDAEHTSCQRVKEETVPALGHDMTDWEIVKHPTCEEEGLEERHCTRGDVEETRPIPKLTHRWIDNGDGTQTCEDCGVTEDIPGYVPPEQPSEPTTPDTPAEEPTQPEEPTVYSEDSENSPWLYVTDLSGLRILFDETQSGDTYTASATDRDDAVLTGSFDALDELADDGVQNIVFVTRDHTSTVPLQALRACNGGSFELTHIGDSAVLTVDGKPVEGLLG